MQIHKKLLLIFLLGIIGNIQAQKKTFDYYYELGRKQMEYDDYSKAKLCFDTSILKKPNHANSYFNRALCYGILNNSKASLEDFIRYIKLVPNDPDTYELIGNLKKEMKDTIGAIRAYDSCLKYSPSNFDLRISRGKIYWIIDSIQKAHKDFDFAYKLDTNKV
jgi:tetratricopeptide (TPR) repeat protein